jgi:hypothetical protein
VASVYTDCETAIGTAFHDIDVMWLVREQIPLFIASHTHSGLASLPASLVTPIVVHERPTRR